MHHSNTPSTFSCPTVLAEKFAATPKDGLRIMAKYGVLLLQGIAPQA